MRLRNNWKIMSDMVYLRKYYYTPITWYSCMVIATKADGSLRKRIDLKVFSVPSIRQSYHFLVLTIKYGMSRLIQEDRL